jgi:hypothetical protein
MKNLGDHPIAGKPITPLECGGQGRNRTADASLFRAALWRNPLKSQGTDGSSRYAEGLLDTLIEPLSNPRLEAVRWSPHARCSMRSLNPLPCESCSGKPIAMQN